MQKAYLEIHCGHISGVHCVLMYQVIERQAQEIMSGDIDKDESWDESPSRADGEEEEEEDMDIPVKEELEDIPLTKSGYTVPPAYPPIQVR